MEYGGVFLNRHLNRGNDGGSLRKTSDAFQLALAVIYQNPAQNFALAPNNLQDAPTICLDFMKSVPTLWDDTVLIDGYPGKYVVLARKSDGKWYVAGINAGKEAKELILDLGFLGDGAASFIHDGENGSVVKEDLKLAKTGKFKVSIPSEGGFVIVK